MPVGAGYTLKVSQKRLLESIFLYVTLPNLQNPPAHLFCLPTVNGISSNVPLKLFKPKRRSSLRNTGIATIGMTVPKTTMHENHCLPSGKYDVRATGHIRFMQPKSEPRPVQRPTHGHFR